MPPNPTDTTNHSDERSADVSRRDIAGKLLAGIGVLGLASCVDTDEPPDLATATEALSGGSFLWADTLTNLRAVIGSDTATSSKPVIVMGGYAAVGDGGGGIFYWDKSASTGDNGGTIVVPTGSSTGRWLRIFIAAHSVRWFGAKGNGTIDDTLAIQNTIAACAAAGGGTVLLPNGTYIVSNQPSVHAAGCIAMASNVTLLGQSREGSVIKLKASQPGFTRPIMIYSVADVAVRNLSIDGNKANNDTEEHRAGIFTDDCNRVHLADLNIYNCTGDALDVYGEVTGTQDLTVERCYFHDNLRKAVTLNGNPGRRLSFRDCVWQNNVGQLHIESGLPAYDLLIDHCLIDQNVANSGIVLSLGGAGDLARSVGLVCKDCVINGPVSVIYAEGVRIQNCRINPTNTDGTPPLTIQADVLDCVVDGCTITLPVAGVGGGNGALFVQGAMSLGTQTPRKIRITNNRINAGHVIEHAINIVNADEVLVAHNTILATAANHGGAAIAIAATDAAKPAPTVGTIMVTDNYMFDFKYGVAIGGFTGLSVRAVTIANNVFEKGTNTNAFAAWDLDDGNTHVLQSAAVFGNDVRGYSAFYIGSVVPPNVPIPVLIGGTRGTSGGANRNGMGIYSVYGDPNFRLTESPGAMALSYAGGARTTLYVKESGVNTNTGWVAK